MSVAAAPHTTSDPAPALAPSLAHLPVPLFASVMGTGGLALAWRRGHELFGLPAIVADLLVALAVLLFLAVALLYGAKALRHPQAVVAEWRHPVRAAFFPAVSIGLLLIASGIYPAAPALAEIVWLGAALLHLSLTVRTLSRWIRHKHDITHLNPAWFIPVVGNVIVPLLGVKLGYFELSWLAFGIGIFFWPLLFAVLLYRVIFHDDLPPKLMPTLFILVAPPAVAFQSWMGLNGGHLDALAHILFAVTLFLLAVLATLGRRLLKLPFAVSWWAYTFPLDAAALALGAYALANPSPWAQAGAALLLAVASLVVAVVLARTLRAFAAGHLFAPD